METLNLSKLPSSVIVPPTSRCVGTIKRDLKGIKGELTAIMSASVLGRFIKAFRKRNPDTIEGMDTVWGVYVGRYAIVYLKYQHVPGGITPCKVMFLSRAGKPLAYASSLKKLIPLIGPAMKPIKKPKPKKPAPAKGRKMTGYQKAS